MLTPPPDMHPGCTWAEQKIPATNDSSGIGTAATVEARTGLTTRFTVHAYGPHTRTVLISPDTKEDRAGAVRSVPAGERNRARTVGLDDLDEVRLVHRRDRDDITALHTPRCRHVIKAAFTAGGDRGVPPGRRVYKMWMRTTQGRTFRFLVKAPSQASAYALSRTWWQGRPGPKGFTGGRLDDGERIDLLTCEGARDTPTWPYPGPVADPA